MKTKKKKILDNGKIDALKVIEEERKLLSPQELKLLRQLTKRDKNERFRRILA